MICGGGVRRDMRWRIVAIWGLIGAAVLLTRQWGLLRFPSGTLIFQFPKRGYYDFDLTVTAYALGAGLVLLSLGAFWKGWKRRAALWLAGLARWSVPALFLGLVGWSALDARQRWGWWQFVPTSVFLAACGFAAAPRRWRLRLARRLRRLGAWGAAGGPGRVGALFGLAGLALLLGFKFLLYADTPMTGDGASSLFQAYILARGRLKLPRLDFPEFYTGTGIFVENGWYSMYPPGHPLMLAAGVVLHAPWLIGPLSGAATAALVWAVGARWFGRRCGALAGLLLLSSPHWMAMSASYMSHTSASLWLAIALWALCRSEAASAVRMGFLGGFSLGMAFITRPLTGLAMGAPLAAAFVGVAWRRGRLWPACAAAGVGSLIPAAFLLLYNAGTTGSAWLLGYQQAGDFVRLGFGGKTDYTALKGLFQGLNNLRAFSAWGPGCFPSAFTLLGLWFLCGPFGWRELTLAGCWLALPISYFFYYFQDFALGPRFVFELGPFSALLGARAAEAALTRLAAEMPRRPRRRWMGWGFAALSAGLVVGSLPTVCHQIRGISDVHQSNLDFVIRCKSLACRPNAVFFLNDNHQGIIAAENARHPEGPLFLQHRGEERNRQFMAAHPEREYFFGSGGWFGPYEDAPEALRRAEAFQWAGR